MWNSCVCTWDIIALHLGRNTETTNTILFLVHAKYTIINLKMSHAINRIIIDWLVSYVLPEGNFHFPA